MISAAANPHNLLLPACVAGTVLLLLLLIVRVRLHPALALTVGALSLGLASGMPLQQVPVSFTGGVGSLMGRIVIILGFGAVLGALLARSGGAAALGSYMVDLFGRRGVPWALLVLGIVVGMPVFFEVGLVLMMPIVLAAARRSGQPPILVAAPLLAGLSIMHSTVPPHPAAMLAAAQYHADLGRTILYGLVIGIPAAAVAGPLLGWVLIRRWAKRTANAGTATSGLGRTVFSAAAESPEGVAAARRGGRKPEPVPAPAGPSARSLRHPVSDRTHLHW